MRLLAALAIALLATAGSGIAAARTVPEQLIAEGRLEAAADAILQAESSVPDDEVDARWSGATLRAIGLLDEAEQFARVSELAARASVLLQRRGLEAQSLQHLLELAGSQIMRDQGAAAEDTIAAGSRRAAALKAVDPQVGALLMLRFAIRHASVAHWGGDYEQGWQRIAPLLPQIATDTSLPDDDRFDALLTAGRAAARTSRTEDARRWLEAALADAERGSNPRNTAVALEALARLHALAGKRDLQIPLLQRADAIFQASPGAGDRSHTLIAGSLAMALAATGKHEEARPVAERASAYGQALIRSRIANPEGLDYNMITAARFGMEAAIRVNMPAASGPGDPQRLEAVLEQVQRAIWSRAARAGAHAALEYAAQDRARGLAWRKVQEAEERWAALDSRLASAAAVHPGVVNQALFAERQEAAAALASARAAAAAAHPALARLADNTPVTLTAIQKSLRSEEAVVVLYPFQDHTVVAIAITREGAMWNRETFDPDELCQRVLAMRRSFDPDVRVNCEAPLKDIYAAPVSSGFDSVAVQTLYQRLFGPLLPLIGDRREWMIAAGRILIDLPYNVLVTRTGGRPHWLIEERSLRILPGLAVLPAARSDTLTRKHGGKRTLVAAGAPCIGSLSGDACNDAHGPAIPSDAPYPAADALKLGTARSGGDADAIRLLPALSHARAELEGIARAQPGRRRILAGADATEARLRTAMAQPISILAFATHGLAAGEFGLDQPALVMTPPSGPASSAMDDGLLTAGEIAALRLDAGWVILSACRTAGADGSARGQTLSGLAQAFFEAGVPTILASLWPVFDRSQSLLTTGAIAHLSADAEIDHAAALRLSILDLIAADSTGRMARDPAAWGGLIVVGAPETR